MDVDKVRDVPRPRHRPREISDSSATQVRLSQSDGVTQDQESAQTEKAGVTSRVHRVLVDAFSGAGVHSIHADPSLNRELATRLSTQDMAVGIMLRKN